VSAIIPARPGIARPSLSVPGLLTATAVAPAPVKAFSAATVAALVTSSPSAADPRDGTPGVS
jgi:hypothetical protein